MLVSFVPPQVGLSDLRNLAPKPDVESFLISQPSPFKTGWSSDLHSLLPYILLSWQLLHALQPVLGKFWPERAGTNVKQYC